MPPSTLDYIFLELAFVVMPCALPLYLLYRDSRQRKAQPWEARSVGSLSRGEFEALLRRVLRDEWHRCSLDLSGTVQSDPSTPPAPSQS